MTTSGNTSPQTPADEKTVGEGLAEELAEILHLPVDQLRPLPRVA